MRTDSTSEPAAALSLFISLHSESSCLDEDGISPRPSWLAMLTAAPQRWQHCYAPRGPQPPRTARCVTKAQISRLQRESPLQTCKVTTRLLTPAIADHTLHPRFSTRSMRLRWRYD